MTLLKRFMGWAIGLTKGTSRTAHRQLSSPQFRALSWRLLSSYIGAMAAVIGLATIVEYQFVAYRLNREEDHQLTRLANAAAHNLSTLIKDPQALQNRLPDKLDVDNDGDLDIPWQDLREEDQTVEWFGSQRRLIASVGRQIPSIPLEMRFHPIQQNNLRLLTIPVYFPKSSKKSVQLWGYVRVSDSTIDMHDELHRLLAGLGVGNAIALALIGVTGWWLTQRSLQPVDQSMQRLQQFTADASHELRNPLAAVKTAVEVMQSHPERIHSIDQPKLAAIASATDQMTTLLEDLLLLARSDANTLHLDETSIPIPMNDLLEDVVDCFQTEMIRKNIALKTHLAEEAFVRGNAMQLKRLFTNLIDNALQYTPTGGCVEVTLQKTDQSITVQIEDTGIGIAAEALPRVFDRFWRADQARTWRTGGSGLGLAIAQAIAQTHSGEITVTSHMGKGSCFQVCLPKA